MSEVHRDVKVVGLAAVSRSVATADDPLPYLYVEGSVKPLNITMGVESRRNLIDVDQGFLISCFIPQPS